MFKWLAGGAFVLSIAVCALWNFEQRMKLGSLRADIDNAHSSLAPLDAVYQQVRVYQTKKEALQKRIDIIIQLKLRQGPAAEVAKLAGADASSIDSVAVAGRDTLVVNRR